MSVIFADPGELYAIADRIERHADAVRANATMLAGAVASDHWHGSASEVFAAEAGSVLKDMWACARRLDDAADALRRHARRVQGMLDLVKQGWDDIENWGAAIVADFSGVVADTGGLLESAVAGVLGHLVP